MLELVVEGVAIRVFFFSLAVLCDTEPRNCKECRELCSPLPVEECVVQLDKTVWCRCDGRGQRGYEPPKGEKHETPHPEHPKPKSRP